MVPKAKGQKLEMLVKEGDKLFKRILNLERVLVSPQGNQSKVATDII